MPADPHALKIHIDGSAFKNPGGPGGFAAIAEYPCDWNHPDEELFREGYKETTNNRMELRACIRVFEYVHENSERLGVQRVLVITDSAYVCQNHRYTQVWRRNKWRTSAGRPVENVDLWKKLLSLQSRVKVRTEIIWGRGKTTPILRAVDRAAKAAARQPWEVDLGFRAGKVGRSRAVSMTASIPFPACGQEAIIRVYRSGLVGKRDHKIFFDLFSEERREFIKKYRAYAEPEKAGELHRGHCYRVLFNNNPKYPIIARVLEEVALTGVWEQIDK